MEKKIVLIPGDGIGPEIVGEAKAVLAHVAEKFGHTFSFTEIDMGGCSIDRYGEPLTDENLQKAKESDAVLLGAVGGNAETSPWYKLAPSLRPEAGLLKIRKELGLFANLRPAFLYPELAAACPLKPEQLANGFDLVIVRELTGGLYFGERHTEKVNGVETAVDTLVYTEPEIRRIAIKAFEAAAKRRKSLISVDKANVLDTSRLWRRVMEEVGNPGQFDVIVTENTFGDILSDEASMVTGSIGMLPSASLNETKLGLYEPSHGSAPDIAGQDKANPLATILSAAMLLRYSFDMESEARAVESAVAAVLRDGYRTPDIYTEGAKKVGTREMGALVRERI